MTLRRGQLRVSLDRVAPAGSGQHAFRTVDRVRLDEHVRVDAGSEIRLRVHRVGEAGAFHQQRVDAGRRERLQKNADRLRGTEVERRRHPQLASEIGGLGIGSLFSRQGVRQQEMHTMPAGGRDHIARQAAAPAKQTLADGTILAGGPRHHLTIMARPRGKAEVTAGFGADVTKWSIAGSS